MEPQVKIYRLKDLAINEAGTFRAVFATLNVEDSQGDVTLPGAFGEQKVLISQYNHGSWDRGVAALPIGVGRIFEQGNDALIEGEFDMDDPAAVATYKKMRYIHAKGRVQEFSYALPEVESFTRDENGHRVRVLKKIRVPEVSPVLMGAGVNTRLLDIKSGKTVTPGESETEQEFVSRCIAFYVDEGRDADQAAAICHRIWREAKAGKPQQLKMLDHVGIVISKVAELLERLKDLGALRQAEGGTISEGTLSKAQELSEVLTKAAAELAGLRAEHDSAFAEYVRFQRIIAERRA